MDALRRSQSRAFTLIELLVVLGIIAILMGILLPAAERVRHRGYLQACANHLHTIGQAVGVYASENRGQLPRTRYAPDEPLVFGTGAASPDPFIASGPSANDVTAAFYLLAREQRLPLSVFICPYDDVFEYQIDGNDPATHSNFTDYTIDLGYSFADPYPSRSAVQAGYVWNATLGDSFPLAADKNPGVGSHGDNVNAANLSTNPAPGCSRNHERDGQNVLYADGHVQWSPTPLCGPENDNIYTNRNHQLNQSPLDRHDALLLPTDDPE